MRDGDGRLRGERSTHRSQHMVDTHTHTVCYFQWVVFDDTAKQPKHTLPGDIMSNYYSRELFDRFALQTYSNSTFLSKEAKTTTCNHGNLKPCWKPDSSIQNLQIKFFNNTNGQFDRRWRWLPELTCQAPPPHTHIHTHTLFIMQPVACVSVTLSSY